jgi:hypothetical protein
MFTNKENYLNHNLVLKKVCLVIKNNKNNKKENNILTFCFLQCLNNLNSENAKFLFIKMIENFTHQMSKAGYLNNLRFGTMQSPNMKMSRNFNSLKREIEYLF